MSVFHARFMMLLCLFLLCRHPASCQPLSVEFTATKPHCLLYFLESMRGEPHHTAQLRHYFMDRRGIREDDRRHIENYRLLLKRMEGRVRVKADGNKEQDVADLLEMVAANSSTTEEMVRHSRVFLPAEEHALLRDTIRHFEPLYTELFWKRGSLQIDFQLKNLRKEARRADLNGVISRIASTLESTWPRDEVFMVALVPVPRKKGEHFTTFAHSNGFLQVIEAPDGASIGHAAGVIVHEICHALWYARKSEEREKLKSWFSEENGHQAYQELNEALATALGNGWAAHAVTGKKFRDQWYNDDYVDGYSKSIYHLAERYCQEGRALDRDFARACTGAFRKRFPHAAGDPRLFMRELVIVSNEPAGEEFRFRRARRVPIRSIFGATPLNADTSRKKFQDNPSVTGLFMVTPAELTELKTYGIEDESVERMLHRARNGTPLLCTEETPLRKLLFCIGETRQEQEKALESLFK